MVGRMPIHGKSWNALEGEMKSLQAQDPSKWRDGRAFGVTYGVSAELLHVVEQAFSMYVIENARHQHVAFLSLHRYETEVLSMTADLFRGPDAVGYFVSGGTEGIFMAVKTARDTARLDKGITSPKMILPATAYPIWDEVGHYMGVEVVRIPITVDFRVDMDKVRSSVDANTILLMGSAPGYSFGIMDPIAELSELAVERQIHLHVDACVGGFMLPFLRKLDRNVPDFDFSLPGVTSIGADLHKYGYSAIGSSVLMYRNDQARKHQGYEFDAWPSGTWRNPGMLASRSGGAVAASWAVMNFLGEAGYMELARRVITTSDRLREGISAIPGLFVQGQPETSLFTFGSRDSDILRILALMREKGWFVRPQLNPPSIHMVVNPMHEAVFEEYLADLRTAASQASTK